MQQRYTDPSGFALRKSSRVMLLLAALVLTCGGVLFGAPGCLLTSTPQVHIPKGLVAGASCMCATCLDKLFCMDASGNTKIDTEADPCLGDANHPILAVHATQVDSMTARSVDFFCVPDSPDLNVDYSQVPTQVLCPGTGEIGGFGGGTSSGTGAGGGSNAGRAALEHIGCTDVPVRCLPPAEQAACNLIPGPSDPPCPFQLGSAGPAERTACGDNMGDPNSTTGEINAVNEAIAECNLYGTAIPTDQPRRYCFASCVDETWLDTPCMPVLQDCSFFCDPATYQG